MKIHIVAVILNVNQFPQHFISVLLHAGTQRNNHILIILRTSDPINTGDTRYNDDILALTQRRRRRQTQLINLIVDRRILGNIRVTGRHIGLRLVIIIVGHKILDSVFREELLEFSVKLCRQCFIVCQYQRRLVQSLNDIRHGECLTGTGDTKQRLALIAFLKSFY